MKIRFDGPPGPEAGRFVEVEDRHGKSISAGYWEQDADYWLLNLAVEEPIHRIRQAFDDIRGDWTDPRTFIASGRQALKDLESVLGLAQGEPA